MAACDDHGPGSPQGFPCHLAQVLRNENTALHLALTLSANGSGFQNSSSQSARNKLNCLSRMIV